MAETQAAEPDSWTAVPRCPLCGSERIAPFRRWVQDGVPVSHDRCRDCLLVYQNPCPTQAWYDEYFQRHYWEEKARDRGDDVKRHTVQWSTQLIRAQRYLACLAAAGLQVPAGGRILEIGCAYGMVIRTMADTLGAAPFGAEPSDNASASAREVAQVDILGRFIHEVPTERGPFDLILFSHVLEYIVDQDAVFASIRRLLKPGGILLIGTPNIFFRHAARLEHPYCYCKRSLRTLFARHGIRPVRIEPVSHEATAFTPDYSLTAAGVLEAAAPTRSTTEPLLPAAGLAMRAGAAWFTVANRFPVNRVLRFMNRTGTTMNAASRRKLAELRARTR